jgi:hypothetical protein
MSGNVNSDPHFLKMELMLITFEVSKFEISLGSDEKLQ